MKLALVFLVAASLSAGASAQRDEVGAAKAAGIVGERYDGYLGYAVAPSGRIRAQVNAINLKRRAIYSRFGASRGVSPQEVGITAGCTTLSRVGTGQPYLLGDNVWRRRAAGEAAPRPAYCG